MNYADIKYCDVANGKGVRVSLFVSGCTHHCKGCFNEETWNFHYGKPFTEETEKQVLDYLDKSYILYAIGLSADINPAGALHIAKENIVKID